MKIITTAFGDRKKELETFVKHVRSFTDIPILIISDNKINSVSGCVTQLVDAMWYGHLRYGYRNSNYWRMKALQQDMDGLVLYMDNDIRILSEDFMEGFALANLFGMCMPLSPRVFVHSDIKRGIDSQIKNELTIPHASVCNPGMFFANSNNIFVNMFIESFLKIYEEHPGRGPLGVWLAAKNCNYHPYILPHQWLVCEANAEYCENYPYAEVKPIMLHLSGRKVKRLFNEKY